MKYELRIDEHAEECVVVTAKAPSPLTEAIEALVTKHAAPDTVTVYRDGDIRAVAFADMECITVADGKTTVILENGEKWRAKQRLYELEDAAPSAFIRINKSTIANIRRLERFSSTYAGGVNAVFQSGYTEYVSRRCFADIKRRLAK